MVLQPNSRLSPRTITGWNEFVRRIKAFIKTKYTVAEYHQKVKFLDPTPTGIIQVYIYSDHITERTKEIQKLAAEIILTVGTDKLQLVKVVKTSNSSAYSLEIYGPDSRKIRINIKPVSSVYGGPGKLNELAFIDIAGKVVENATKKHSFWNIHETESKKSYKIPIYKNMKITPIAGERGKGDVQMGNINISLKSHTADYVASLNGHRIFTKMGNMMLRTFVQNNRNILDFTNNGFQIELIKFPYYVIKNAAIIKKLLFTTEAKGKNTNADVVLVGDFTEEKNYNAKTTIKKIITQETIKSLTDTDYAIHFYIRNAESKGTRLHTPISTNKELLAWLRENPNKIPKGLRFQAVFAKKNKGNTDHVEIQNINT